VAVVVVQEFIRARHLVQVHHREMVVLVSFLSDMKNLANKMLLNIIKWIPK
jgi:hypothetical protein